VKDVLELPFDQYQRYRLVSELVEELRPKEQRLTILDVGGRTALLRRFLPRDRITLVDLEASAERPLVLGDGSRLPFADHSFDLVAAFDTLEHVPVARRAAFVAECARVARRHVILAGPCQTPEVEEAERLLQQFLKDKLGVEHRYLEEHRHNGLPDRAAVEAQLEQLGARVLSVGHGNLERWLALICLSMYMDYRPELRAIAARFQRFYNARLYESDHTPPVYRHAIVAALGQAPLPAAKRLRQPVAAPAGATRRVEELAFELVDFERAHAESERERELLKRGMATLEADLAGHRRVLAEALATRSEQAEVIGTLERDLVEHRRSLADLERELAAERARYDEALRGHALVLADLEQDLAGQREAARVLAADLAGHAGVIAELRALQADYEDELGTLRATLERERTATAALQSELEARLGEQQAVLATLEQDLAGHRATLAAERAERARVEADLRRAVAEVEQDRDERGKVIAALERELAEHRRVTVELEREVHARGTALAERDNQLAQERAALADERRVLAAREAELDEHRAVVRTLEADLAGHREVLATLRDQELELRRVLAERLDALNQTRQALDGARGEIAAAAAELARQHALIETLRFELRGRWKAFKRAFGPRRPIP